MSDFLNCEFSAPLQIKKIGENYVLTPIWSDIKGFEFSKMNCTSSGSIDNERYLIEVSNGTSTFFWDKRISTFEFFSTFLLAVLILMLIFDFLYRFVYKIKVNFRH